MKSAREFLDHNQTQEKYRGEIARLIDAAKCKCGERDAPCDPRCTWSEGSGVCKLDVMETLAGVMS